MGGGCKQKYVFKQLHLLNITVYICNITVYYCYAENNSIQLFINTTVNLTGKYTLKCSFFNL